MPALVVPDEGELVLLERMLRLDEYTTQGFLIHLYTNDYTPNRESEYADFTEVVLAGYSAQALANADWNAPTTVGGVAQSVYGTGLVSFTVTGGTTPVYGYFVTDEGETTCIWAQRFDALRTLDSGNPVQLIPILRLYSESQPAP